MFNNQFGHGSSRGANWFNLWHQNWNINDYNYIDEQMIPVVKPATPSSVFSTPKNCQIRKYLCFLHVFLFVYLLCATYYNVCKVNLIAFKWANLLQYDWRKEVTFNTCMIASSIKIRLLKNDKFFNESIIPEIPKKDSKRSNHWKIIVTIKECHLRTRLFWPSRSRKFLAKLSGNRISLSNTFKWLVFRFTITVSRSAWFSKH